MATEGNPNETWCAALEAAPNLEPRLADAWTNVQRLCDEQPDLQQARRSTTLADEKERP